MRLAAMSETLLSAAQDARSAGLGGLDRSLYQRCAARIDGDLPLPPCFRANFRTMIDTGSRARTRALVDPRFGLYATLYLVLYSDPPPAFALRKSRCDFLKPLTTCCPEFANSSSASSLGDSWGHDDDPSTWGFPVFAKAIHLAEIAFAIAWSF
jgi:hypothetical protein